MASGKLWALRRLVSGLWSMRRAGTWVDMSFYSPIFAAEMPEQLTVQLLNHGSLQGAILRQHKISNRSLHWQVTGTADTAHSVMKEIPKTALPYFRTVFAALLTLNITSSLNGNTQIISLPCICLLPWVLHCNWLEGAHATHGFQEWPQTRMFHLLLTHTVAAKPQKLL